MSPHDHVRCRPRLVSRVHQPSAVVNFLGRVFGTGAAAPRSHRVFSKFAPYEGWAEPGFERGFYGVNIRDWLYLGHSKGLDDRRAVYPAHPPVDEEYFEWIALLTTVAEAQGRFCMAELGAGWGRWMAAAAMLCRQKALPFSLIGVEAEPSHFEWMQMVLRDNDVDPDAHHLVRAAVAAADGDVILTGPDAPRTVWGHRTVRPDEVPAFATLPDYKFWTVPDGSLRTLFDRHEQIDLVDIDVQGVEYDILAPAFETLNRKVAVVHIGTHSTEVEKSLLKVFRKNRWHSVFSFPSHSDVTTPFGRVAFCDGVQTWVNPARRDLVAAFRA
jgi:FkbM family methyltransferase